ncbi:hypothetical protein MPSEU_001029300 [Mayamaea pseudoterrestris]|nr:hypothetical protein MPSEU_001029300 [Mayamaea pseudoterrestris]
MTVALCLPGSYDLFPLVPNYTSSFGDHLNLDLPSEEDLDLTSFFDANNAALKKHKIQDVLSFSLTDLLHGPISKRPKIEAFDVARLVVEPPPPTEAPSTTDLLHHACCESTITLTQIQTLVMADPLACSRAISISSEKEVYDYVAASRAVKQVKESYTFPLNLAIKNNLSADIIEYLIDASGPSVLLKPDGLQQENSLMILLKQAPHQAALIDKMLSLAPQSAMDMDIRSNTCLHIACRFHASLATVRHLCMLHPASLNVRNYWRQTPLDIVQSSASMSTDDVSVYLWERQAHSQEEC